jgi:hypothetical protein
MVNEVGKEGIVAGEVYEGLELGRFKALDVFNPAFLALERWPEAVRRLQGGSVVRKAGNGVVLDCKMTRNRTSYLWEMTKQQQTGSTASEPSESTNPGAPLPQGDALVAYENVKREKSCLGKGNESEIY